MARGSLTIAEAVELYLVQLLADGRSDHTRAQYRRHLDRIASWLTRARERVSLDSVDVTDVAAFFAAPGTHRGAHGTWKKASSLNTLRSSVRTFFRFCHGAGWIARDPAALLRRAICGTPPPRALAEGEVQRLLDAIESETTPSAQRDLVLCRVLLDAGLRLREATGLDVSDLRLDASTLVLRKTKGDRTAFQPIGPELRGLLESWTQGRHQGPLFVGRRGRRLSGRQVERRLKRWARLAGLPETFSVHSLRHTCATRLYERTGDLGLVQLALRHRSISSTARYARAPEEKLRRALVT